MNGFQAQQPPAEVLDAFVALDLSENKESPVVPRMVPARKPTAQACSEDERTRPREPAHTGSGETITV
jgi:hypothetical protein